MNMSDSTPIPVYKKRWVVRQNELDILQEKAERRGLRVQIVARPGESFEIGAADCEIADDQFGIWVLGDSRLSPEEDIEFFHEVDDAWNERRQTGGTKEAPNLTI